MEASEEIRRFIGRDLGVDLLESREVELKGLDGSHRLFAVDLG